MNTKFLTNSRGRVSSRRPENIHSRAALSIGFPTQRGGATSVEFAFVFPLILVFFIAMTVMTQAFVMRDTAQHAAYEGARAGLVVNSSVEDVEAAVEKFTQMLKLRDVEVAVDPPVFTQGTNRVTVTVSIPYRSNAWCAAGFMPEEWSSSATISLRRIQNSGDSSN